MILTRPIRYLVNFLTPPPEADVTNMEGLEPQDIEALQKIQVWRTTGMAYAMTHATRPGTIGLVVAASPLALLAWIGEKYLEWSHTPIPLETILRLTSMYWFTSTMARGVYPYRDLFRSNGNNPISKTKPLGYSAFNDLALLPKAWNKYYPNLKFRKDHSEVSDANGCHRMRILCLSVCMCVCLYTDKVWHAGWAFCCVGATAGFPRGRGRIPQGHWSSSLNHEAANLPILGLFVRSKPFAVGDHPASERPKIDCPEAEVRRHYDDTTTTLRRHYLT